MKTRRKTQKVEKPRRLNPDGNPNKKNKNANKEKIQNNCIQEVMDKRVLEGYLSILEVLTLALLTGGLDILVFPIAPEPICKHIDYQSSVSNCQYKNKSYLINCQELQQQLYQS